MVSFGTLNYRDEGESGHMDGEQAIELQKLKRSQCIKASQLERKENLMSFSSCSVFAMAVETKSIYFLASFK